MTWDQLGHVKDIATIGGIIVGLAGYATNSYFQFRNKRIENVKRYFDALEKLYAPDGLLLSNLTELEKNGSVRKPDDSEEKKFIGLLIDVEKVAYLTSHGAVPTSLQVYMFGWFATKLRLQFTDDDRHNVFWELAIHYIDELAKAAAKYSDLPQKKRDKHLQKNALVYRRYSRRWRS